VISFDIFRRPVDVFVKLDEADEEGNADQVLHTLDVLVEINQGIYFLEFPYRLEKPAQKLIHVLSPLTRFKSPHSP
jgi:hypothetical protein